MRMQLTITTALVSLCLLSSDAWSQKSMSNPHKKLKRSCEECHTAVSFADVRFDHSKTGFALEGRHKTIACLACHSIEDFSEVAGNCISCHEDVHLGQLGVTCEHCHTSRAWNSFDAEDIHSRTDFPLMGRHVLVDCASCHHGQLPSSFHETSTECVSCHQMDYLETTNPNHVAGGFNTECQQCHQFSSWRPAIMPDHDPFFPIFSGTHRNRWSACIDCHTDPGNPTVFSCLGCHEHDQTPMDDKHAGISGYTYASPECYGCHPTGVAGRFSGHAQFFPIYSGAHNGSWSSCATCHVQTGNPQVFDCLGCHEHDQTPMDDKHAGMTGYAYASTECYSCHPTGVAGQFNHVQFFPIYSGAHSGTWNSCATCHVQTGNPQVFDCLGCHEHDQAPMDDKHAGMPGYTYASTECLSCHPSGVATQFDHAQFFPIYTGRHAGTWNSCATCHIDSRNAQVFDCLGCHAHDQTLMDSRHQGEVRNYVYQSQACYDCHRNGRGEG